MKKLLIASTALVATAGMAAADGHAGIKLSGSADMGIQSSDTTDYNTSGDVRLWSELEVKFNMTGETDSGLSFGASVQLDEAGASHGTQSTTARSHGGDVFIKGGFGALTMGDTDGALDWAMTETAMGTAMADDHTEYAEYSGNSEFDSGLVLRYDNTFGDFGVALSASNVGNDAINTAGDVIQAGVKYNTEVGGVGLALGLGYADAGTAGSLAGLSVKTSVAGFDIVLNYSDGEVGTTDYTRTGVGVGYTVGDVLLHANWSKKELGTASADGYGLVANYSLGGGATAALGYAKQDDGNDTMSLGLVMSF